MHKFSAELRVAVGAAAIAIVLGYFAARHGIDYTVYWVAGRALLSGSGAPMYGVRSGLGWPLVYRYPPLFLFLFIPFAFLPLKLGAFLWAVAKFIVLYFLTRSLFARLWPSAPRWLPFLALVPTLPYLAIEFHYGNAEFLVFAATAAALLLAGKRPMPAGFLLGLGIAIKLWPFFFVPYLVAKRRARVAALAVAFTVGLTLAPAAYFGWRGNAALLGQWWNQEFGVAFAAGEPGIVTFPSQSLHGELMRYLVSLDYTQLPDPNYPKYNVMAVDPRVVQNLWVILAGCGYLSLLLLAWVDDPESVVVDAVAFCSLVLLEPFAQNTDLVVLFWPIVAAVCVLVAAGRESPMATASAGLQKRNALPRWPRALLWVALALVVLQPLVPGSANQRALRVLGVDFTLTCLLCAGLVGWCLRELAAPTDR